MLNQMIAYMELHEISLLQDAEKLQDMMDSFDGDYDSDEYEELEIDDMHNTGELIATRHLLSVAHDILASSNERN
jgi:hypothetical protein